MKLFLLVAALTLGACYADDVRLEGNYETCTYEQAPVSVCDPYFEWVAPYYIRGGYIAGYYRVRPAYRGHYRGVRPVHAPTGHRR